MAAVPTFSTSVPKDSLLTLDHIHHLTQNGYCVIENVFDEAKCTQVREAMHDFLLSLGTNITKEQIQEGTIREDQMPYNLHGIITYPRQVGREVLLTRFAPEVSQVFSALWNCKEEDLITSEDRACFMQNYNLSASSTSKVTPSWLHVDQPSGITGLQCVQGLVTMNNVSEQGGTLVVIPKSHLYHEKVAKASEEAEAEKKKQKDIKAGKELKKKYTSSGAANKFVRIIPSELDWLKTEYDLSPKPIRPLKAGSMVLWDSRLTHCNIPTRGEERIVVYTCQVPRQWAIDQPRKQLQRKKEAFMQARATAHWPNRLKIFGNKPRIYGGEAIKEFASVHTEETQIVAKHLSEFEALADGDEKSLYRLVRLVGFDSIQEYKNAKTKPPPEPKKRKRQEGDDNKKPKKKKRKTT